jgi:hypothetical protein
MNAIVVRAGVGSDLDQLARIWFDAWKSASGLERTLAYFRASQAAP